MSYDQDSVRWQKSQFFNRALYVLQADEEYTANTERIYFSLFPIMSVQLKILKIWSHLSLGFIGYGIQ